MESSQAKRRKAPAVDTERELRSRKEAVEDLKRRVPETAAVIFQVSPDSAVTLPAIMLRIILGVDIKSLKIEVLNARMSRAGRIILAVKKD